MSVLVHKHFLGTPRHALIKDSMLRWTDAPEDYDLTYGVSGSHESIEPLLNIFKIEIPELVPPQFKRAMETCGDPHPPWSEVLPKALYNSRLKSLLGSLSKAITKIKSSEYFEVYKKSNNVFPMLRPSTLEVEKCKAILNSEDNHVIRGILRSSRDGLCQVPVYDRASTKTGRLTIKDGPQVLTLKKEYRSIFKASKEGSKIFEVDFSSLEPRVASNIAQRSPGSDVYLSFMEYSGIRISRDASKLAVLCALYGASTYSLQKQLREQGSTVSASSLIQKVNDYFDIGALAAGLKKAAGTEGVINNYFGRPISVDDARPAVLVNNYLQSTAVDVSLLGFERICSDLQDLISPLFIIHDAMFFEAQERYLTKVSEYLSNGFAIEGLGNFPLKVTEVMTNE